MTGVLFRKSTLPDVRIVRPACFLVPFTWTAPFLSYSKVVSIPEGALFHVNNKDVDPVF